MVLLASWLSRSSVESWERLVFCRAAPPPRPDPVGAGPAERLFRSRQLALREAGAPVPWLEVPRVSWPC